MILSDTEIDFPEVTQPNILVCLTQEAYTSFSPTIRPGGLVITDSRFVTTFKKVDGRQIELPVYETVMEKIGKPIVFNICVLGALIGITDIINPASIMEVIKTRVPKDFVEMNSRALELGIAMGAERK